MVTAVYSGSFNPLHIGHLAILRHLSAMYDGVMLVVSPKNPLKDSISADSGRERYEAALAAVARHPELSRVEVSDVELSMEPPYYTVKTLDRLSAMHPGVKFVLTIGGDQIANFSHWKDWERILTEYGIVVFPREGFDSIAEAANLLSLCPGAKISLADVPLVNVSSSQIRAALSEGRDVSALLM